MSRPSGTQRSFGQLAKRISAWTTRALFTAVVLVAALGFGRQVMRWWHADAAGPAAPGRTLLVNDGFGSLDHLHMLQFGNSLMSLARQSVTGSKAEAIKALQRLTREAVRGAAFPTPAASDSERRFLTEVAKHQPVDHQPGQWWLYQVDNRLPMFVGIRAPTAQEGGKALPVRGAASEKNVILSATKDLHCPRSDEILRSAQNDGAPRPPGQKGTGTSLRSEPVPVCPSPVAPSACRVVTWGMAVPMENNAWTLYVFSPGGCCVATGGAEEIPIPPGSDRLLSMQVAGGGRILSFKGRATPESWTRFYDRWLAASDWQPRGGWRRSGSVWGRHCGTKAASPGGSLDLEFVDSGTGQLTGLALAAPTAPSTDGKKDP